MGMIYAPPSIIPNGALINDVCHIYQSIKPTARPNNSALQIGDRWYNPNTGIECFWNGTYWLSSNLLNLHNLSINSAAVDIGTFPPTNSYFIEKINCRGYFGNRDANNYYTINLQIKNRLASNSPVWSASRTTLQLGDAYTWGYFEENPNFVLVPVVGSDPVVSIYIAATATGNPGFMQYFTEVMYRIAY